ncbi:hypothetical protein EB118_06515 [bacterium]|nr:hypothetical protein [bacterium]
MRFQPISALYPNMNYRWDQWVVQDTAVNSIGSRPVTASYREVNNPVHVEPAAKLYLSPEAIRIITQEAK